MHLNNAGNRLGDAVLDHGALTNFGAHAYIGHIAQENRRAVDFLENDVADVVGIADKADATNQITFGPYRHLTATAIGIIAGEGGVDILNVQVVVMQPFGVNRNLIFAGVSTHRIDFGDARHTADHRANDPVLNNPSFGQLFDAERMFTVGRVLQGVLINLPQPRRNGSEDRRDARRHAAHHFDQAFENDLTRRIDIGFIGKDQRNNGDPIAI